MPAHFVVTEFHGKRCYVVEFYYSNRHHETDGRLKYPIPVDVIEISDALAAYPLDVLIDAYVHGIRPKKPTAQPLALPVPEQPALIKPRNEMG
jgi:hypothetical protein